MVSSRSRLCASGGCPRGGPTLDLLEQVRDVIIVKGQSPAKHNVEDHATGPDVDLLASVQPAGDDLGRGVVRTAARRLEEIAVAHHV